MSVLNFMKPSFSNFEGRLFNYLFIYDGLASFFIHICSVPHFVMFGLHTLFGKIFFFHFYVVYRGSDYRGFL